MLRAVARILGILTILVLSSMTATTALPFAAAATPGAKAKDPQAGIRLKGDLILVRRASYEHYVGKGLPDVLQSAFARPRLVGTRLAGFELSRVRPGSVWTTAGFRKGDVVTALNGEPLTDPIVAIMQLNALRGATRVAIDVERGGRLLHRTVVVQ